MNEELSPCCNAPIRYLDCEDCRKGHCTCIYICTECGATIEEEEMEEQMNYKIHIEETSYEVEDA